MSQLHHRQSYKVLVKLRFWLMEFPKPIPVAHAVHVAHARDVLGRAGVVEGGAQLHDHITVRAESQRRERAEGLILDERELRVLPRVCPVDGGDVGV